MTHILLLYILRTQMEIAATECHWQSPFTRQICAYHPRSHQQPNHLILININSNSKLQCQSLPRSLISFQTKPRLGASFSTIRLFCTVKKGSSRGEKKFISPQDVNTSVITAADFPKGLTFSTLEKRGLNFKENFFTQDH